MRKRIVALFVAVCMAVMPVVVHAEDFSLRNGILFGDSIEEVKTKETLTIDEEEEDKLVVNNETVSGISGANIVYFFNDSGLYEMRYTFEESSFEDITRSNYNTLYDGLVRKYGEPLNNANGTTYIITTEGFEVASFSVAIAGMANAIGDFLDYDEWIVKKDNYNVKIDLYGSYIGDSYSKLKYRLGLAYKIFSDEDVETAVNEKQEQQNVVDNDL